MMSALVTKCVNASRAKTKEKALEIILMYIEIDKHEMVQEELMKGLENKQPKIVYACVQAFRTALELVYTLQCTVCFINYLHLSQKKLFPALRKFCKSSTKEL